MEMKTLFCVHCGKKFVYDPSEPPRFCLYCGKRLIIPTEAEAQGDEEESRTAKEAYDDEGDRATGARDSSENNYADNYENNRAGGAFFKAQQATGNEKTPNPTGTPLRVRNGLLELYPEEYKGAEANTDFINDHNERIMTGWLPKGFIASADQKPNVGDLDFPLALWARAMDSTGREWFCRRLKRIQIDKNNQNQKVHFLPYDEYLDMKAASLLGTASPRLILRVPAPEDEMQQIRETLKKRKQELLSLSKSGFSQCIVQGEYSALGGKLYEANAGGHEKYLFLYAFIIGDEYGFYNKQLYLSRQQIENTVRSMRQMVTGSFGGAFGGGFGGLFGRQQQAEAPRMPEIDTDPNTPFGRHRADGLSPNFIVWNIVTYAGFLSDTLPTREELCDFLRFVYSLKTSPELEKMIHQYQEQAVNQQIQTQQQMANIMQNAARQRQQQFDRHNAVMNGIRAEMDAINSQRIASDNAAFDRSVRKSHEMVMGVDTYRRTDGTTVEADVGIDRVFQRENDPSILVGAPKYADIPFGWTELDKLD